MRGPFKRDLLCTEPSPPLSRIECSFLDSQDFRVFYPIKSSQKHSLMALFLSWSVDLLSYPHPYFAQSPTPESKILKGIRKTAAADSLFVGY